jgi:hypothetical protein
MGRLRKPDHAYPLTGGWDGTERVRSCESVKAKIASVHADLKGWVGSPGVLGAPPLVSQFATLETSSIACLFGSPSSFVRPYSQREALATALGPVSRF